jgi:hypothetical protein
MQRANTKLSPLILAWSEALLYVYYNMYSHLKIHLSQSSISPPCSTARIVSSTQFTCQSEVMQFFIGSMRRQCFAAAKDKMNELKGDWLTHVYK